MKNKIQCGDNLEFTAPADVTSGTPVLIGALLVVPAGDAASGARFIGVTEGVFETMPKATGSAWTEGELLYWDSANSNLVVAPSATARRVGFAVLAAASGDTTGTVMLTGNPAPVNVA